jgi:predicted amidohydrolase YtcJ
MRLVTVQTANFNRDTTKKDLRWRIEHAQHINPKDIPRFREMGVIASMQGIHCTSDAPFVEKRLGTERARTGAYPWRSLLDAGVVIANGTDAPVEDISAIESFYASVTQARRYGHGIFSRTTDDTGGSD